MKPTITCQDLRGGSFGAITGIPPVVIQSSWMTRWLDDFILKTTWWFMKIPTKAQSLRSLYYGTRLTRCAFRDPPCYVDCWAMRVLTLIVAKSPMHLRFSCSIIRNMFLTFRKSITIPKISWPNFQRNTMPVHGPSGFSQWPKTGYWSTMSQYTPASSLHFFILSLAKNGWKKKKKPVNSCHGHPGKKSLIPLNPGWERDSPFLEYKKKSPNWSSSNRAFEYCSCAALCRYAPPSGAAIHQCDPAVRLRNVRPQTILVGEVDQFQHL